MGTETPAFSSAPARDYDCAGMTKAEQRETAEALRRVVERIVRGEVGLRRGIGTPDRADAGT